MKTGDSRAKGGPGFLPLQGHNKRWKVDQRPAVLAYRLVDRKDAFGELGQWVYDEETVGDLNLGFLWEIPPPNSNVATVDPKNATKAGKRDIPGWAFAWPVVTEFESSAAGAQKPYKIGLDVDLLFAGGKKPVPGGTASGVAPTAIKRCAEAPNKLIGYPVGDYKFSPDKRYISKKFKGIPLDKKGDHGFWPKFPGGWIGIGLTTTEEYQQTELFFPTDPRLVAVNVAGDPTMGSLVCDLTSQWTVDPERMARLHSAVRVIRQPISSDTSLFAKDSNGLGMNSLAFQLRPAACDGAGYGMFVDDLSGRVRPGQPGYDDIANVQRSTIAMGSFYEYGALCVGRLDDQHRIGADDDGNPINSLHLNTRSYFIDLEPIGTSSVLPGKELPSGPSNPDRDGPLFFEGDWLAGDTYTHTSLVHLGWDEVPKHPFTLGNRKGYWKWWAEIPFTTVTPPPHVIPFTPTLPLNPFAVNNEKSGKVITPEGGGKVAPPPTATPGGGKTAPSVPTDGGGTAAPSTPTPGGGTAPNSPTNPDSKKPFVGTHMQVGTPGLCAWPQNYATNLPNYASNPNIGKAAAAKIKSSTPITGQIDAYGAQGGLVDPIPYGADSYVGASGDPWVYTQYPGPTSKFAGGTANGGFVLLPPQVSLSDEGTGLEPPGITLSTTYFIAAPNTYWGAGLPELADGSMRVGYSWGVDDTTGDLIYRSHGSAPDDAVRFTNTAQNIGWRSGTNFWGTLDHAIATDQTWTFPDASGMLVLGGDNGIANTVAYWFDANTLIGDTNLAFDGTILTAASQLRVGTATDTATAGDAVFGLTGAARTFYDQSAATQYWYNASNAIVNQLSAVAGTATVFNEQGADQDWRVEGDTDTTLLSLDAGLDAIGIGTAAVTEDKVAIARTATGTSGSIVCLRADYTADPSAGSTASHLAFYLECDSLASNAQNFTGGTLGAFIADTVHRGTGTVAAAIAGQNRLIKAAGSGDMTQVEALRPAILNQSAGTITLGIGILVTAPVNSAGGAITTYEGIRIGDSTTVTGITNNFALRALGGDVVLNENGVASDFRVEGDTLAYMLFCNGSAATLENIALLTTAEPNWQTMDRGMFVGDVTTAPTGNPATGFFHYSVTGQPTWRDDGGVVYQFTQATGGQNVTNSVTDSGSTAGTIPDITDGVTYANDYTNLRRALYQLARMLKQDHDQLRAMGFLT